MRPMRLEQWKKYYEETASDEYLERYAQILKGVNLKTLSNVGHNHLNNLDRHLGKQEHILKVVGVVVAEINRRENAEREKADPLGSLSIKSYKDKHK